MIITTFGTSHGNPTPERFNSSSLIEVDGHAYLVDAGAPVHALMVRHQRSFSNLRAIFITHMHEDHVGGLPNLIKMIVKLAKPGHQTTLFLPEAEAADALEKWLHAMHIVRTKDFVNMARARKGPVFLDDRLCVHGIQTRHLHRGREPASFGYILQTKNRRVLFTGDLRSDFSDFPKIAQKKHFDAIFCESTHYQPQTAVATLKHAKTDRIIFNHVYDDWHGRGEQVLKEHYRELPYEVDVAHDGDRFEL